MPRLPGADETERGQLVLELRAFAQDLERAVRVVADEAELLGERERAGGVALRDERDDPELGRGELRRLELVVDERLPRGGDPAGDDFAADQLRVDADLVLGVSSIRRPLPPVISSR